MSQMQRKGAKNGNLKLKSKMIKKTSAQLFSIPEGT